MNNLNREMWKGVMDKPTHPQPENQASVNRNDPAASRYFRSVAQGWINCEGESKYYAGRVSDRTDPLRILPVLHRHVELLDLKSVTLNSLIEASGLDSISSLSPLCFASVRLIVSVSLDDKIVYEEEERRSRMSKRSPLASDEGRVEIPILENKLLQISLDRGKDKPETMQVKKTPFTLMSPGRVK
ncbi:hypothetical protein DNTS_004919 [Danionella cerebrum]|uniref:Uncharacterized protein n=1 Tax=Danionella cerebrum TaxID=2873325 RepID=A0A553MZ95_9TELE|nr:hypothetical protein DNTS_004919 [Danionella translucida]